MPDASLDATASPSLREAQRAFFEGLLRAEGSAPEVITPEPGLSAGARFSVYRNAYRARLVSVLRSDHPTVVACLGERFDPLAVAYARRQPSRVRSLRDFGNAFPAFIGQTNEPHARALQALAQFERTLLDVFDAEDRARVEAEALDGLGSSGETLIGLVLHPSVRVLEPGWSVTAQWHAHRAGEAPPAWVTDRTPWLLWRSRDRRTQFRAAGESEAVLARAALCGDDLSSMCTALLEVMRPIDVPSFVVQTLRRWVVDGLVSGLRFAAASG